MLKERVTDPIVDARIGLAGPVWGLGAAVAAWLVFLVTGAEIWRAIAELTGFLNLFNLMPIWQLDGARGFHALSRQQRWAVTATVAVVLWLTDVRVLWLVGAVALYRTIKDAGGPGHAKTLYTFIVLVGALSWFARAVPVGAVPQSREGWKLSQTWLAPCSPGYVRPRSSWHRLSCAGLLPCGLRDGSAAPSRPRRWWRWCSAAVGRCATGGPSIGLNRGVGGTVFHDAAGRPWFPLDEARRDVPLDQIATFAKDAVIAIEDHRYYLHPGVDPLALARAAFYNVGPATAGRAAAPSPSSWPARSTCPTRAPTRASSRKPRWR